MKHYIRIGTRAGLAKTHEFVFTSDEQIIEKAQELMNQLRNKVHPHYLEGGMSAAICREDGAYCRLCDGQKEIIWKKGE